MLEPVDPAVRSVHPGERRRRAFEPIAVLLLLELPDLLRTVLYYGEVLVETTRDHVVSLVWWTGACCLLLYLMKEDRIGLRGFGVRREKWWVTGLFGLVVTAAGVLVQWAGLVAALALHLPWFEARQTEEPWFLYPVLLIVAAAFEEFLYRAYLWNRLVSLNVSPLPAMLVCVALFTVSHGYSAADSLSVALYGFMMAFFFWMRRSVWPLILGHWLGNLLITYGEFIPVQD